MYKWAQITNLNFILIYGKCDYVIFTRDSEIKTGLITQWK